MNDPRRGTNGPNLGWTGGREDFCYHIADLSSEGRQQLPNGDHLLRILPSGPVHQFRICFIVAVTDNLQQQQQCMCNFRVTQCVHVSLDLYRSMRTLMQFCERATEVTSRYSHCSESSIDHCQDEPVKAYACMCLHCVGNLDLLHTYSAVLRNSPEIKIRN